MEIKTLEQLKNEHLPVATVDLMGIKITPKNDLPETKELAAKLIKSVSDYLKSFVYSPDDKCVQCGATLGGLLGTFRWGMCHGEGTCECGYPARAYHRIEGFETFQHILQYHLDILKEK